MMSKSKLLSASAAGTQLCVFCGKDESYGPMTREHFVPRALWDKERPQLTRTVPAHKACNKQYSDDNEYFRDVLAMEEGAKYHPEVIKLHEGTLKRKFERRFGSVRKTLKDLRLRQMITPSGLYVGDAPSFRCNWPRLERVLRNVMKGIYYTVKNEPLPQGNEYLINVPYDNDFVRAAIEHMVPWQSFGDTVFMCRYGFNSKQPGAVGCLMRFYEHRLFFGISRPQGMAPPNEFHGAVLIGP